MWSMIFKLIFKIKARWVFSFIGSILFIIPFYQQYYYTVGYSIFDTKGMFFNGVIFLSVAITINNIIIYCNDKFLSPIYNKINWTLLNSILINDNKQGDNYNYDKEKYEEFKSDKKGEIEESNDLKRYLLEKSSKLIEKSEKDLEEFKLNRSEIIFNKIEKTDE